MHVHACGWVYLFAVQSQALRAPGLPETLPPVCAATTRLARDVVRGWSPTRHWLYHAGFRRTVHTLRPTPPRTCRAHTPTAPAPEAETGDFMHSSRSISSWVRRIVLDPLFFFTAFACFT